MDPLLFFLILLAVVAMFLPGSPKPSQPSKCKICDAPVEDGETYCSVCALARATSQVMHKLMK